jgi:hypothetical protein
MGVWEKESVKAARSGAVVSFTYESIAQFYRVLTVNVAMPTLLQHRTPWRRSGACRRRQSIYPYDKIPVHPKVPTI